MPASTCTHSQSTAAGQAYPQWHVWLLVTAMVPCVKLLLLLHKPIAIAVARADVQSVDSMCPGCFPLRLPGNSCVNKIGILAVGHTMLVSCAAASARKRASRSCCPSAISPSCSATPQRATSAAAAEAAAASNSFRADAGSAASEVSCKHTRGCACGVTAALLGTSSTSEVQQQLQMIT
jgi:hypothetical protein